MAETTDYDLTDAESALLMAVTREAMASAGALGASLNNMDLGVGLAKRGGAAGGRFGARFTRPRTAAASVDVAHDPPAVCDRVRAAIVADGAVIEDPNSVGDGSIWGVVASGALDMVPALVRVDVEAARAGGSRVSVRATGREGLIKQKIAGKAVDRICAAVARIA
jgi:hypothetical protein